MPRTLWHPCGERDRRRADRSKVYRSVLQVQTRKAMKIATFNVNNVNKRIANLLQWLSTALPDVACLQELKAEETELPISAIEQAGYRGVWRGQKSWNGVALLARGSEPIVTHNALPGD